MQSSRSFARGARLFFSAAVLLSACAQREARSAQPGAQQGAAAASQPIDTSSEAAFTQSVLQLFRRLDPASSWTTQEHLVLTSSKQDVVNLHRPWSSCQQSAGDCDRVVEHYATTVLEILNQPKQQQADRSQLMAVVRGANYFEGLPAALRANAIVEPFVADMVVIYVVDEGGAVRGAKVEDLTANGVSREALPALSRANLGAVLPMLTSCEPGSVMLVAAGNFYESSRLLLSAQWTELAAKVQGNLVVAVPSNDALVIACGPKPGTLEKLSKAVAEISQRAERPVSQALLKWTGSGWQVVGPGDY